MSVISSLLVAVGVDPSGVGRGLGEADSRIGQFANGLNRTGAAMTKGITLPLVALGGFALKSAMDIDEAYDTIRIGTGATGKELEGLESVFDRVAKRTPAQLGDVADTVADLNTRLGLTGPVLEKLSRQVLEAGRMGGVPIDIKNATAAFSVFNVQGKDTTVAMDDLFRVSQATGVGINDLTAIMAKSGGVLTQLGFNFTESASLIGVLDKAGINSRAVMSSMSAGLVKLAKDGEAPADAFKRTVGELQGFIDKGEKAKALKLAGEVFGSRGAGQFVAALQSGKVNLDQLTKSAGMSGDSILGVAKKTKDFPEIWQEFKNQAQLALAPIAAEWLPKIGDGLLRLAGYLRTAQQWWSGLSDSTQGYIEKGVLVGALIGPSLMVLAKAIALVQAATTAAAAVQAAFAAAAIGTRIQLAALAVQQKATAVATWLLNAAMAANPVMLVVIAIAALVAGLVIAYQKSETFRDIVNGAFGAVKDFVGAALDWIIDKATSWGPYLLGALGGPVGILVVLIVKHWDTIKEKTAAAWDWVVGKVKAIPGLLVAAFLNFTLPGLIIKHWDTIKEKTSQAWGAVVDYVKSIPGKLLSFFLNWTLAGRIIQHWDDAKDGTVKVATSIVNWVADLPGKILGKLASLAGGLHDTATEAFGRLRAAAEKKATALLTFVASIPGKVKDKLGDLSGLLLDAGRAIIDGLIAGIRDKAFGGPLGSVLGGVGGFIKEHKGPIEKDRVMLIPHGRAIMAGLIEGIGSKRNDLGGELGKVTGLIDQWMRKRFESDKLADAATRRIIVGLRDERAELLQNDRAYDRVVKRLEEARDRLSDLVTEARNYAASVRDMVVASANITGFADQETGTVTAEGIVAGLKDKLVQAWQYQQALEQLAAMGLSQTYIDQLTAAGVEGGLATALALAEGGQAAVDEVNQLNALLVSTGQHLGNELADTMYGTGIQAAQALVDSLEKQRDALERTGRRLARAFARALQDELNKVHVTVKVEKFSVDQAYAGASSSTAKAVAGKASTAAERDDRTDELLEKLDELVSATHGTTTAVENQPHKDAEIRRKGGR